MLVRKLWPWERGLVRDHLLRLDPEDRAMRFCTPVSDDFIHGYCDRLDPARTIALGGFVDGRLRGTAELIPIPGEHPPSAELDLSVERAFQRRGHGGRLMRTALAVAQNRLIRAVLVVFLPENEPMRRLLARHGASVTACSISGEARIALAWPGPASALAESAAESEALMDSLAMWGAAPGFAPARLHAPG